MAINSKDQIEFESAGQFKPFEAMVNSGDSLTFTSSFSPWSGREGFAAVVLPMGLVNGGVITGTGTNNQIAISAATLYMAAATTADANGLVTVAGGNLTLTRPAGATDVRIVSITVNNSGAFAAVNGTDGTAFSATRGANGGPPLIPVDSVEIGQVQISTSTAAPVLSTHIFQVIGTSQERWDFPLWSEDPARGKITFFSALPAIHVGTLPKRVYVKGFVPLFAPVSECYDWVPAEQTSTSNSVLTYDGPRASSSTSVGQASFSSLLRDGHTDPILALVNQNLWFRFRQNRLLAPYQLTQGILNIARTYQAGNQVIGSFTVTAERASIDFAS